LSFRFYEVDQPFFLMFPFVYVFSVHKYKTNFIIYKIKMLKLSKNLLTGKRGIMYYWGNEDEEFLKR
jgi:hypothetical protein